MGESVTISVVVANIGDVAGSYEVTLKIKGKIFILLLLISFVFQGIGSQAAYAASEPTIKVVAASNATADEKAQADYVCDGTADQTEINAALAASTQVSLSSGTFTINAPITKNGDNISLEGQGGGTLITVANGSNCNIIEVGGSGWVIENLKIDGNSAVQSAGSGIFLYQKNDTTIRNVETTDCKKSGIYLNGSDNCIILGCVGTGNVGDGIRLITANENTILGNICQGNSDDGIGLNTSTGNIIDGNLCEGSTFQGISLSTSCSNNTITDNTCRGNREHGIFLYNSSNNNIISGNNCQGNTRYGIDLHTSCNFNTITANTCQGNVSTGIILWTDCVNNTISGNTSQGNGGCGIFVGNSSNNNVVAGNNCQENGGPGIYLSASSNNNIDGNTCYGNSQEADDAHDGIFLDTNCDFNSVTNNVVRRGTGANKQRYGIRIYGATCDGNIISGNDLYDSGNRGDLSDGGTGTVLFTTPVFSWVTLGEISGATLILIAAAVVFVILFRRRRGVRPPVQKAGGKTQRR